MPDDISRALRSLESIPVPPRDVNDVKRAARRHIWLTRAIASVSLITLASVAAPIYSEIVSRIGREKSGLTAPAASETTRPSPLASASEMPCDFPRIWPTYLPWARDDEGIPPDTATKGSFSAALEWHRVEDSRDMLMIATIPPRGLPGDKAPSLPNGTPGALVDLVAEGESPTAIAQLDGSINWRWSINWPISSSDGCKSWHMAFHQDGLTADEERAELLRIANSLVRTGDQVDG